VSKTLVAHGCEDTDSEKARDQNHRVIVHQVLFSKANFEEFIKTTSVY